MRLGFVRSFRLAVVTAVLLATACDSTPTDFDTTATERLEVNPTYMVIPGGRSQKLDVRAVNAGRQATYADVITQIANCGEAAGITVITDPDQLDLQPPGKLLVFGEIELGANCIALSADGARDTVDVVVTADAVAIDAAPTLLRAGQTGLVETRIITFEDSLTMTPFDLSHVIFTSDDSDVGAIDATGFVTTEVVGSALLTVTWVPDSTGIVALAGTGTTRVASVTLDVVPNVPDTAFYDVGDNLGAFELGEEETFEVVIADALGNVNTNASEITGVSVDSSDPLVATATAELVVTDSIGNIDPTGDIAHVFVTVTAEGGGQADIFGTVTTSEGPLDFTGVFSVVAPAISAIVPPAGGPGEAFTVIGTGLSLPGLTTAATVNGFPAGEVVVVSDTELTVTPNYFCPGTFPVQVSLEGVVSNTLDRTQDPLPWNADDYEAAPIDNNDPDVVGPIQPRVCTSTDQVIDGSVGPGDADDFFRVTTTDPVVVTLTLDWDDAGNDIDIYVVDGGFTAFICFDGGTLGKPEVSVCSLQPNTEYLFWVEDFGPGLSNYTLDIDVP
jgi:hypothetical protein